MQLLNSCETPTYPVMSLYSPTRPPMVIPPCTFPQPLTVVTFVPSSSQAHRFPSPNGKQLPWEAWDPLGLPPPGCLVLSTCCPSGQDCTEVQVTSGRGGNTGACTLGATGIWVHLRGGSVSSKRWFSCQTENPKSEVMLSEMLVISDLLHVP